VLVVAIDDVTVAALSEECSTQVVEWRRQIHAYPELGFQEHKTAELSAGVLRDLGLDVQSGIASTGIVATLYGSRPGPTVALRADMDALPVIEETGLPFESRIEGRMHACGHDAHTAMLLGAATVLSKLRPQLHGNVKFIFQPSEERMGGARPMIEAGVLREPDVEAIFATHIWPDVPYGCVHVHRGPAMASLDEFSIRICGQGGHVATPHKSVDAISAAGFFISGLQSIVSRELDPTEPVVVSVGRIEGGTAYNAIASEVFMHGTVRTVDSDLRRIIRDKIEDHLRSLVISNKIKYHYDYHFGYACKERRHGEHHEFHALGIDSSGLGCLLIIAHCTHSTSDERLGHSIAGNGHQAQYGGRYIEKPHVSHWFACHGYRGYSRVS
jgi:amidohydrolase